MGRRLYLRALISAKASPLAVPRKPAVSAKLRLNGLLPQAIDLESRGEESFAARHCQIASLDLPNQSLKQFF